MPPRAERVLAQMRQRKRNWPRRDVVRVLRWAGFIEDTERGRGSHVFFIHSEYRHLNLVVPSTDPVRIYIVNRLLAIMDELGELEKD